MKKNLVLFFLFVCTTNSYAAYPCLDSVKGQKALAEIQKTTDQAVIDRIAEAGWVIKSFTSGRTEYGRVYQDIVLSNDVPLYAKEVWWYSQESNTYNEFGELNGYACTFGISEQSRIMIVNDNTEVTVLVAGVPIFKAITFTLPIIR